VKHFFLGESFPFEDFCRETLMHRKLKHRNVLDLLAVTIDPPCSVTEFMPNGTVYNLLGKDGELFLSTCLRIASDAAEGMIYLHANGVLHRDLKTHNLLIDEDGNIKIADFGISRFTANTMTTGAGSIQYMAPEVFVSGHYTEKADVYSFAIILWELITREAPHWASATPFMVMSDVRAGKRLELPDITPPAYAQLVNECWHQDPHRRPDFHRIKEQLMELRQDDKVRSIEVTLREGASPRSSRTSSGLAASLGSPVLSETPEAGRPSRPMTELDTRRRYTGASNYDDDDDIHERLLV